MTTIAKTIIVTEYLRERIAIAGTFLVAVYLVILKLTPAIFFGVDAFVRRQTF